MVRRKRRHLLVEFAIAGFTDSDAGGLTDQTDEPQELLASLDSCLDNLQGTQRDVVERFYFGDESAESIARNLGRRPGAIRMLLLRVREALKQCSERQHRDGTEL